MAFGKYQVLGPLARARLGELLLAEAPGGGPRLCLLPLDEELGRRPGLRARLLAAAEALRSLGHPGMVAPLDVGDEDGAAYLVTEYLGGERLEERLAAPGDGAPPEGALDPLEVGRQIAEALVAAAGRGLCHGALSARRVLLQQAPGGTPRLRLLGVGVAQVLSEDEGAVAAASAEDVRALGELLERLQQRGGRAMSTAPTLPPPGEAEVRAAAQGQQAPARDLSELVARMTEADPAARPPLEHVLRDLERLQGPRDGDGLGLAVQLGQSVGSYRLVRRLGGGGMGVVFEALHTRLSRQAAIKVLRPELSQDQEMVRRFFTEAESVNIVRHPGIVSIYEFGQLPDRTVYIVMEYLDGDTLERRLRRAGGRLDLKALRLLRQVASALQAAHERGVVHRDLKPDNIMIVADPEVPGGERAKVLDFGIAKMAAAADSRRRGRGGPATEVGQALGTPQYMAPEQCQDAAAVDDRADVYSLGVLLYEVLTGRPPFQARGFAAVAALHLHAAPPPLRELEPSLPEALERLLLRMLAKQPGERPAMGEVAAELERFVPSQTAPAAVTSSPEVAAPAPRPRRGALGAGAQAALAAALLALPLLGYVALRGARSPQPAPVEPPLAPAPAPPPAPAAPAEAAVDLGALRARAIAVLQEGLREQDPVLRRRALAILGQGRDSRYAALAEPLLRDLDATVAAQAAQALGQLRARDSAPVLLRAASGPAGKSPRVLCALGAALRELGAAEGEALLRQALRGKDEDARDAAGLLLLERADRRGRKALGRAPLSDELLSVLGRLARGGDRDALALLQGALKAQKDRPGELPLRIAEELAHAEDPGGRALLEQVARDQGPLQLRAARILAGLDDPAGFALFTAQFAAAGAPLPDRVLAAEGLGACGRRESVALLAQALPRAAGPLRLRMAAAGAILQIAASDPALILEESLRLAETGLGEERVALREAAADALGEAEPRVAVPLLGRAIKDEQPAVRQSAARALGRTRARAAVPVLDEALDDTARTVRREAMNSIGKVGRHLLTRGERVDDIARRVAGRLDRPGGDEGERLAGVTALVRLGDTSRREQLRSWLAARDPEIRREAIDAWSADPGSDGAPLNRALADPAFPVRFAAAARLAERGDRAAVPVLQEALSRRGPEALSAHGLLLRLGVESTAEAALQKGPLPARLATVAAATHLPPAEALQLLSQGARDGAVEVRHKVIEVAGELPSLARSPGGLRLLQGLRGDDDAGVRLHAGLLLARLGLDEGGEGGPPELRRARAEYLAGRYAEAIELARKANSEPAWSIIGAAACRKGDGPLAEEAYRRLQDLTMRRYVAAICQHARTPLPAAEAAQKAEAPRGPRAARPATPAGEPQEAPERPITNDRIGLPPRALKSTVEIKE